MISATLFIRIKYSLSSFLRFDCVCARTEAQIRETLIHRAAYTFVVMFHYYRIVYTRVGHMAAKWIGVFSINFRIHYLRGSSETGRLIDFLFVVIVLQLHVHRMHMLLMSKQKYFSIALMIFLFLFPFSMNATYPPSAHRTQIALEYSPSAQDVWVPPAYSCCGRGIWSLFTCT